MIEFEDFAAFSISLIRSYSLNCWSTLFFIPSIIAVDRLDRDMLPDFSLRFKKLLNELFGRVGSMGKMAEAFGLRVEIVVFSLILGKRFREDFSRRFTSVWMKTLASGLS
jgi:hypothetical protein